MKEFVSWQPKRAVADALRSLGPIRPASRVRVGFGEGAVNGHGIHLVRKAR
ncbi:MAG: hypothetical protein H0T39_14695 [Actinobacteria bacterium]|nr:hypothetical protein [Actinomycetota bacterium]